MDFTDRERAIIDRAVEEALRLTPELAQQLTVSRLSKDKIKIAFYDKLLKEHPAFKQWNDIIKGVVEKMEDKYPGDLDKALSESIPEIKRLVAIADTLDFNKIEKPSDLTFKRSHQAEPDMGEL